METPYLKSVCDTPEGLLVRSSFCVGAWAVAALMYHDTGATIARKLFPVPGFTLDGRDPNSLNSYHQEWADRFNKSIGEAVGHMDEATFRRFVELAITEHGLEAQRRHGVAAFVHTMFPEIVDDVLRETSGETPGSNEPPSTEVPRKVD